jgi:Protein of unknown function (DUF1573)
MKIIFTWLCCATLVISSVTKSCASNITNFTGISACRMDTSKPAESITLKETEFDFGKIPQGKPVTHIFEFKNTGDTALSLDNVQASCGCTTPEWNKDVVPAGGTSKITVGYNAQNEGPFAKPVTITYNGNQVKQIIIKGEVWKTPVTSAPENTSINSLKNEQ